MNYCTNELDCNYAVYKNKKCFYMFVIKYKNRS